MSRSEQTHQKKERQQGSPSRAERPQPRTPRTTRHCTTPGSSWPLQERMLPGTPRRHAQPSGSSRLLSGHQSPRHRPRAAAVEERKQARLHRDCFSLVVTSTSFPQHIPRRNQLCPTVTSQSTPKPHRGLLAPRVPSTTPTLDQRRQLRATAHHPSFQTQVQCTWTEPTRNTGALLRGRRAAPRAPPRAWAASRSVPQSAGNYSCRRLPDLRRA
mmetsp:Transcript_60007/g.159647  ORF Transcript_60007/g.159647 Transcript_60007/m.159647 type:complete len:214 (+) Transcript_60007:377-1018(+)